MLRSFQKRQAGKIGGVLRVHKPQPLGGQVRIREAHVRKLIQKNPTLLQKLKELAAEVEYDEDIVPGLTSQEESYNIDESRDHITTNSTVITVLICQTG